MPVFQHVPLVSVPRIAALSFIAFGLLVFNLNMFPFLGKKNTFGCHKYVYIQLRNTITFQIHYSLGKRIHLVPK